MTDTTKICAIHGTAFRRAVGVDGGPEWACPIIHMKDEPRVFKVPTVRVPAPWKVVMELADGARYWNNPAQMSVIVSGAVEQDGKRWVHVSVARPTRLPSYDDMAWAKQTFMGADAYAYSVRPPVAKHVNIHPNCLHLWSCLDGPRLPEFSGFVSGLGRSI